MGVSLPGLGVSLAIGGFLILGILITLKLTMNLSLDTVIDERNNINRILTGSMIAVLCVIFGMFLEDSEVSGEPFANIYDTEWLAKNQIRTDVLFCSDELTWLDKAVRCMPIIGIWSNRSKESDYKDIKPTVLCKDIAANGIFQAFLDPHIRGNRLTSSNNKKENSLNDLEIAVRKFDPEDKSSNFLAGMTKTWEMTELEETYKRLMEISASLYYVAKNEVFKEGNYYDELSSINVRATTANAVLGSVKWTLLVWIIIFFLQLGSRMFRCKWIWFSKPKTRWPYQAESLPPDDPEKYSRRVLGALGGILLVSILLLAISSYVFYKEKTEYNKRVYGYFTTMIQMEKYRDC